MITGDKEGRADVREVNEEVLCCEDAFGRELIFGVEKVASDNNNFLVGGVLLDKLVKFLEYFCVFFFSLVKSDMDIGDVEDVFDLLDGSLDGNFGRYPFCFREAGLFFWFIG